jgi:signal transduction histidine kinase
VRAAGIDAAPGIERTAAGGAVRPARARCRRVPQRDPAVDRRTERADREPRRVDPARDRHSRRPGARAEDALRAAQSGSRTSSLHRYRDSAEAITQQVDRMSRQVDYHLARARAASSGASGAARCSVATSAEGLIRTLRKLYAARSLEITWSGDPGQAARVQREDLDEMLGNLLDNACKWAASRISMAVERSAGALMLTVDDDGPGFPEALRSSVLERGVRAEDATPGPVWGWPSCGTWRSHTADRLCSEALPSGACERA